MSDLFGGSAVSWPLVKLAEVCTFENGDRGTNYPSKDEYVQNGVPFINAGNLGENGIDKESLSFITKEKFDVLSNGKIKENDILFCLRGSLGKFAIVEGIPEGAIASSLIIIRATNLIHVDYLFNYFRSSICQKEIDKFENGAAQPNLSGRDLKEFKIPLPPLAEQKRIAAILNKADAIRRKRQQAIKLADEFLRSVFLEMFGDPVTNPKGWEVKEFGEVCSCSQGVQIDSELQLDKEQGGYSRFLRIINYTQANTDFKYIPTPQSKKAFIKSDEIVMVRYGATAGFVGRGLEGYLANNLFKISSNKVFFGDFLYFYLKGSYFQKILSDNKQGGAMPAISFGQINEINMYLPPLELQQKFAQVLHKVNLELEKQKKFLKFNLFESLSQKAFSGSL